MPPNFNDVPTDDPVPPTTLIEATQVNVYKHNLQWPLAPWQTRLIQLLPGLSITDDIDCELHVVDLIEDDGVGLTGQCRVLEYEALSYSWGRPERTKQVRCNGILLLIPPGLHEALSALRLPDDSLWLWCDALCINQDDPSEKSVQVQKMLQIFRKASRVRAWLGQMNSERQVAFDLMKSLPELDNDSTSYVELLDKPVRDIHERSIAIATMTQPPWFRRTWVRQEVWANRNLILKCGREEIPFTAFVSLVSRLEVPPHVAHLIKDYYHLTKPQSEYQKLSRQATYCDNLRHLLRTGRRFEASDDRDRIYSLLGMLQIRTSGTSNERTRFSPLVPDYTISVSQAYQRFVKFCINSEQNLACLERPITCNHACGLPSWATDWRLQAEENYLPYDHLLPLIAYKSLRPPPVQRFHDEDQLLLKGTILGNLNPTIVPSDMLEGGLIRRFAECASRNSFRTLGVPDSNAQYAHAGCYVPACAEIGDLVLLLDGSHYPFVVRLINAGQYRLVGRAAYWIRDPREEVAGPEASHWHPSPIGDQPTLRCSVIPNFSVWLSEIFEFWDLTQEDLKIKNKQEHLSPPTESSALAWREHLTRVPEVHRISQSERYLSGYRPLPFPYRKWRWHHPPARRARYRQPTMNADTLPQQEFVIV